MEKQGHSSPANKEDIGRPTLVDLRLLKVQGCQIELRLLGIKLACCVKDIL